MRAEAAIKSTFPVGHPLCLRWDALLGSPAPVGRSAESDVERFTAARTVRAARGIFQAAYALLKEGRLTSFAYEIRAETVEELLDQAEQLNRAGAFGPAAVLAGGALETHLRHVCERAGVLEKLAGHGSIEKYKNLLDVARKEGVEILSKGDAKLVTAWADDRNLAAHEPAKFTKEAPAVRLMIEGIRQLVARAQ